MKKVTVVLLVVIAFFMFSCGNDNQNAKNNTNNNSQTEQKEVKKYSQEWLMNNLTDLGIEVPKELTFDKFEKEGVKLKISYKLDNIDSVSKQELFDWQKDAAEKFAKNGFKNPSGMAPTVAKGTMMDRFETWTTRAAKTKATTDSYVITSTYDTSTKGYELLISYDRF